MPAFPDLFLLATSSAGKAAEYRALLDKYDVAASIKTYKDFDLSAPEETGTTFIENASIKLNAGFEASHLPTLADDSGLCVEALNGDPGLYSADWAELRDGTRNYAQAMKRIDEALGDKLRGAYFTCTLLLTDGENTWIGEGRVYGTLLPWDAPQGDGGHGYDPWFVPEGYDTSFGVLPMDVKNALSHRQRAFEDLLKQLDA